MSCLDHVQKKKSKKSNFKKKLLFKYGYNFFTITSQVSYDGEIFILHFPITGEAMEE